MINQSLFRKEVLCRKGLEVRECRTHSVAKHLSFSAAYHADSARLETQKKSREPFKSSANGMSQFMHCRNLSSKRNKVTDVFLHRSRATAARIELHEKLWIIPTKNICNIGEVTLCKVASLGVHTRRRGWLVFHSSEG